MYKIHFLLFIGFSGSLGNINRLPKFQISDSEIFDLVDLLRKNDTNKAKSGQIQVNFQGHTSISSLKDEAPLK